MKTSIIALLAIMALVVSPTVMAYGQARGDRPAAVSVPAQSSYYNGAVFEGTFIRVGFNDYGVLGVVDSVLGGVGFQYPIGSEYESLATGWWGDAWSVFYNSSRGGFSPHDDAWGVLSGVTPITSYQPLPWGARFTSIVETNDGALRINTTMVAWDSGKVVVVFVNITNIGSDTLADVEYKRQVDWDVWAYYSSYYNYWGMDSIRRPGLHMAVAFLNSSIAPGEVYMGFASIQAPAGVDLYWNDPDEYYYRGIVGDNLYYINMDGETSFLEDGAAVYSWVLGDLAPGQSATLRLAYGAGDTLGELEARIAEALGSAGVGGSLSAGESLPSPALVAAATMMAAATLAYVAAWRRGQEPW